MEQKKKQKLIDEYGENFVNILNEARYTSIGGCDYKELTSFAKKIFKLGEEFGIKLEGENETKVKIS